MWVAGLTKRYEVPRKFITTEALVGQVVDVKFVPWRS